MISILYFFHLAKFFGLTPFMLQVDGKNQKPSLRFLVRIPTFLMIFFYSICICSIFWKNKAVSEISNTANWIQVSIKFFWWWRMNYTQKNCSFKLFTVHTKFSNFLHCSCCGWSVSLHNSVSWSFDSGVGSKVASIADFIWSVALSD